MSEIAVAKYSISIKVGESSILFNISDIRAEFSSINLEGNKIV